MIIRREYIRIDRSGSKGEVTVLSESRLLEAGPVAREDLQRFSPRSSS